MLKKNIIFLMIATGFVSLTGSLVTGEISSQNDSAGPYPASIVAWGEEQKAQQRQTAEKIWADLLAAMDRHETQFKIPPGEYRFSQLPMRELLLDRRGPITIEAVGVTFWLDPHQTIVLKDCHDVTVKGLTIDYDPYPFSQGTIVSIDWSLRTMKVVKDAGYPEPNEGFLESGPTGGDGGVHIRFFEPSGDHMVPLPWEALTSIQAKKDGSWQIRFLNDRMFGIADHPDMVRPGYKISFNCHGKTTFLLDNCHQITLEDITLYAGPALVCMETNGPGANTYRRCRWVRRPETNRLMVSARDQLHSYLVEKGPLVENCEFSYGGDDFIAIHSFFSLVVEQKAKTLTLLAPFGRDFNPGSTLNFFAHQTGRSLGKAAVTSFTLPEPSVQKGLIDQFARTMQAQGYVIRSFVEAAEVIQVELDRELPLAGAVMAECSDRCGAGAVIRNNYLHDNTARGIFVRSSGALIENNTLDHIGMSAIAMTSENYWLEAPFARHSHIVNNTIYDSGYNLFGPNLLEPFLGAIHVSSIFGKTTYPVSFVPYIYNEDLVIAQNRIVRPAGIGIFLANCRQVRVENNRIESPFANRDGIESLQLANAVPASCLQDPTLRQVLQRPFYGIFLLAVEEAVLEGNKVFYPPADLYQGLVGQGPWTKTITQKDVP